MTTDTPVSEGKTKQNFLMGDGTLRMFSKDTVTRGDGTDRVELAGKGAWSTTMACGCFELLTAKGIPNHFLGRLGETSIKVRRLQMIPIECVARRLVGTKSSLIQREPGIRPGTRFSEPRIEFYLKDDARHDPLVVYDLGRKEMLLYDAHRTFSQGPIERIPFDRPIEEILREVEVMTRLTRDTFLILEQAFRPFDITLVDLKVECGYTADGAIVLGDIISNDELRAWQGGREKGELSKQLFRDMPLPLSPENEQKLRDTYRLVAAVARQFPR